MPAIAVPSADMATHAVRLGALAVDAGVADRGDGVNEVSGPGAAVTGAVPVPGSVTGAVPGAVLVTGTVLVTVPVPGAVLVTGTVLVTVPVTGTVTGAVPVPSEIDDENAGGDADLNGDVGVDRTPRRTVKPRKSPNAMIHATLIFFLRAGVLSAIWEP